MQEVVRLPLDSLRVDGGTQVRTRIDADAVDHYARELDDLPPVVVVRDGETYWLADGFHRVAAHRAAQVETIDCLVRDGTQRDAVLLACGANAEHGVRRTNADKRAAVNVLLVDAEWATWSDRAIAEACGVSHVLVGQLRNAHAGAEGWKNYRPSDDADIVEMDSIAGDVPDWDADAKPPSGLLDELRAAGGLLGAELVERALKQAVDAFAARQTEATVLLPAATAEAWFVDAWDHPLCFVSAPLEGVGAVVVAYVGARLEAFERMFAPRGHIVVPTPFGAASLKREHRALCAKCGKPCSSGRWCPVCKQHERSDRKWIPDSIAIAKASLAAGKEPSPRVIATRVHRPWSDVVRALVENNVGSRAMHAEWQRQAHHARRGAE